MLRELPKTPWQIRGRDGDAGAPSLGANWALLCNSLRTQVKGLVTQSRLTLYNPVDCSPPGSSFHGILLARILEWVAMPSSRGSSQPKDRTWVSCMAAIREALTPQSLVLNEQ